MTQWALVPLCKSLTTTSVFNHQPSTNNPLFQNYLRDINPLMTTGVTKKMEPLPKPSTNLQGKQIRMSGLDKSHRKCSNTPGDKFQDQQTLVLSMITNRSKINDTDMITKTTNNNN